MPAFEKKLLTWFHKHIDILLLIAVSALGLLIRFMLSSLHADISADISADVMTRRVCMLFDIPLAVAAALLVRANTGKKESAQPKWAYAIMLISFGNIFASAAIGKASGLWVALCLVSILMAVKDKYLWAFAAMAAACLISSWALLLLPFFIYVYIRGEKISLPAFVLPLTAELIRLLSGIDRAGWLPEGLSQKSLYVAYPSFWGFIKEGSAAEFEHYMPLAFAVALAATAALLMTVCRRSYCFDKQRFVWIAFLGCFTAAQLLPGAGSGAAALTTILAWMLVFEDKLLVIPALIMEVLRIWPAAAAVYGSEWMPFSIQGLCWIQTGMLIFYLVFFYKNKLDRQEQV
ncbi:MAG: hypothetical protein IKR23_05575 [Lachnospiraceae bacterium]|nr:hypothetical protein [Lachnospiraceae bacterium]